jgi:hypothetical protein
MKKKSLVIGCGKLFQVIHLKNIKKKTKIKILIDPRKKLLKNILKNDNHILRYYNLNNISKLKKKFEIVFNFSSRQSSFFILKKLIKHSRIIFAEKPGVFNYKQAKTLNEISKNYKCKIIFGYMSRYDQNVIELKKILTKNSKDILIKAKFFISNNNLYPKTTKHFNSKESNDFSFAKESFPNFLDKKFFINYHIFINRYSHIINLINFFYKKPKVKEFFIIDKYNYFSKFEFDDKNIDVLYSNKRSYLLKIKLDYQNFFYELRIFNPLKNKPSVLKIKNKKTKNIQIIHKYTNVFYEELDNLIGNKKNISHSTLKNLLDDFSLINDIWSKQNLKYSL